MNTSPASPAVRSTRLLAIPLLLLALAAPASAAIQPAVPGSIEYTILSNGQSWIRTADPITPGSYVEDLLINRLDQPDGRGVIGIVTSIQFNPDYGVMDATVDFGRDYSVGIVFPELSSVQIIPEPTTLTLLAAATPLTLRRRRRT